METNNRFRARIVTIYDDNLIAEALRFKELKLKIPPAQNVQRDRLFDPRDKINRSRVAEHRLIALDLLIGPGLMAADRFGSGKIRALPTR